MAGLLEDNADALGGGAAVNQRLEALEKASKRIETLLERICESMDDDAAGAHGDSSSEDEVL